MKLIAIQKINENEFLVRINKDTETRHTVIVSDEDHKKFSSGELTKEQLVKKSLTFTRMHLGHINFDSEDWIKGTKNVVSKILDGSLKTPIEGTYELDNVNSMFSALESRKLAGKVILKIL